MLIFILRSTDIEEITALYNYFDIQAISLDINMIIALIFMLTTKYFYDYKITSNLWVDIIIIYIGIMIFLLMIYSIKYIIQHMIQGLFQPSQ